MKYLIFALIVVWFGYFICRDECRKAYQSGYYAGFNSDIATLAFIKSTPEEFKNTGLNFKYVGIGNESGKSYWWSK